MKKKCMFVASAVLCIGIAIGVTASSLVDNINAELRRDFTVVIDGQTQTFRDANGKVVYPVLYNGTTYLPVRAIGELMNKDVFWYENSKTVELKPKSGKSTVTDADVIVTDDYSVPANGGAGAVTAAITLDEAKNIALTRAGLALADVTFTKAKLDRDDGIVKYELDFRTADTEYETEIDAASGNIIEWELDVIRGKGTGAGNVTNGNGGSIDLGGTYAVTLDEAKQIVLDRAGVAAEDAVFTKQERDLDNGRSKYDIEFISGNTEYEAEVDSNTGEITEWKTEILKGYSQGIGVGPAVNNNNSNNGNTDEIALNEALDIAYKRAGLTAGEATLVKSKLDWDDGIQKYEFEFLGNGKKYEVEVNASTGAIIEFDIDD